MSASQVPVASSLSDHTLSLSEHVMRSLANTDGFDDPMGVGEEEVERAAADTRALGAPRAKAFWAAGLLATWQGHGSYTIPRSYLEHSAALAKESADTSPKTVPVAGGGA